MADSNEHIPDLNAMMTARAEQAWRDMPSDVKIALKKQLFAMNPIHAIKEIGRFYKDGRWSIRPYPDQSQWGELGLKGATLIHKKLCESD